MIFSAYILVTICATVYAVSQVSLTNWWGRVSRSLPARRIVGILLGGPFLLCMACNDPGPPTMSVASGSSNSSSGTGGVASSSGGASGAAGMGGAPTCAGPGLNCASLPCCEATEWCASFFDGGTLACADKEPIGGPCVANDGCLSGFCNVDSGKCQ